LAHCIERGLEAVASVQETICAQAKEVAKVAATLDGVKGSSAQRQKQFATLRAEYQASEDTYQQHLGKMMASFEPGLFVGDDRVDWPYDNLDLERWFRQPKSHERRIHGRSHAGVRIVQEGPTLVLVLDAHLSQVGPFTAEELHPYRNSPAPRCQRTALHRRKVMRKARSKKQRGRLLEELERRYLAEN
jgi:hypothetical protein